MRTKYLLLVGLAALLGSCQNENEPKTSSAPGTEGDYRIIIEGDEIDSPSRAGEKSFVGGTASGAGLYDGDRKAIVSATPNSDYEIDYFWGGPASDPDKYTTSSTAATTYDVPINGQDHTFHLKFKEKKRDVIIDAGTGGSVSPSGRQTWKVEQGHQITATPNSGYEFTGWSVSGSGITLDNSSSSTTNVTLASDYSSNGTITANFKQSIRSITINLDSFYSSTSSTNSGKSYEYLTVSSTDCSGIICRIYGQTKNDMDNMDEVSYPVRIEQNQKVMYAYSEWETINQDGDTREKSATPQSFDIMIKGRTILSKLNSPDGSQTLSFAKFNGKKYSVNGYNITFQYASHRE